MDSFVLWMRARTKILSGKRVKRLREIHVKYTEYLGKSEARLELCETLLYAHPDSKLVKFLVWFERKNLNMLSRAEAKARAAARETYNAEEKHVPRDELQDYFVDVIPVSSGRWRAIATKRGSPDREINGPYCDTRNEAIDALRVRAKLVDWLPE